MQSAFNIDTLSRLESVLSWKKTIHISHYLKLHWSPVTERSVYRSLPLLGINICRKNTCLMPRSSYWSETCSELVSSVSSGCGSVPVLCSGMVSGTSPLRSRLARGLIWSSSVLVSLSWLTRGGRSLLPLPGSSASESESRERSGEPEESTERPEDNVINRWCHLLKKKNHFQQMLPLK